MPTNESQLPFRHTRTKTAIFESTTLLIDIWILFRLRDDISRQNPPDRQTIDEVMVSTISQKVMHTRNTWQAHARCSTGKHRVQDRYAAEQRAKLSSGT